MIKTRLVGLLSHAKKYIVYTILWQWAALLSQVLAVFSRRIRFTSTHARYEDLAPIRSHTNRITTTRTKISIVRSMIGTVTARYTTRSSKSAIEKTANTCDRKSRS